MIMSRSADYAIRAMIYLARERTSRFIPLNEIAGEMRTPPFLLARLMQSLVHANLLVSMKGHHGGFRLALPPIDISAAAIVRTIDGPFTVFECNGVADCGLSDSCSLLDMFTRAETALQEVFESVTLEQLARVPQPEYEETKRVTLALRRTQTSGGR